jgi:4-hydroxy-tetrahydrodipicolinate reductase
MMDTLPLVLTTVCTQVAAIRVRRVVDTNQRRIPLQRKSGIGLKGSEFMALAERGEIGHVGLRESAMSVASRMKWSLTRLEVTLEPIIAADMTATGLGSVRPGLVIGQRQVLIGHVADAEVLRMELEMAAGATPIDEVYIDGRPPLHQLICGGVNGDIGTEAVICNLVRPVYEARPGLLTMMDFVMVGCDA